MMKFRRRWVPLVIRDFHRDGGPGGSSVGPGEGGKTKEEEERRPSFLLRAPTERHPDRATTSSGRDEDTPKGEELSTCWRE